MRFIHPEIRNNFLFEKCRLANANPSWSHESVEDAAYTKLWAESLSLTNKLLEDLMNCPGFVYRPIEEYERYLSMEDALDTFERTEVEFTEDE